MKKKTILLTIMTILLTGCTVNYDLKFNESTIEENITIIPETQEEKENTKYFENRDFYSIIDQKNELMYEKQKNKDDSYEFKYTYNFENFKNSRFTTCYDAYTLNNDNGIITLSTSKEFRCLTYDYNNVDNIKINITTEYKVVDNNADEVNGNVYTWNINRDNSTNKPIKFSYNKKKKRKLTLKEFIEKNMVNIIIIASTLLLFILITLSIYIKNKRVNKI